MLRRNDFGFTLVEVLIIIAVISLLITLTLVVAGNWRKSTAETEVKNDLKSAAGAMENYRNFNNGYPTSIPSSFSSSSNVTVTYESGNSTAFCLEGRSTAESSVIYSFDSTASGGQPQSGAC